MTQGNIEETKINFFDPKSYEDETLFEKPEEEQILEARFDPVEWKAEVDKVYMDLVGIEKDLELIKQRGGGSITEDIEECRRHTEMIIELCRDIQGSIHQDVRRVFAQVSDQLTEDCNQIRKHELRINRQHEKYISQLNGITTNKKGLAIELRQIIDKVKALDFESKNLQNQLSTINNSYEERLKDITGSGQTTKIKEQLLQLKVSQSTKF